MMAKKSKRVGRHGKDQSGCLGSLINFFDFRQGRTSQKLLTDKKLERKQVVGAAYSETGLESLTTPCEDNLQGRTSTFVTSRPSVKTLMDNEMCGAHDQKQHASPISEHTKQNVPIIEGRASTSSLDSYSSTIAKDFAAQKPSHMKHSVELDVMVEELCCRIRHNDVGPTKDPEEKLWEAIKVVVSHFGGKNLPKEGKIKPSKEVLNAVEILDSNKEVFLRLLYDPDSEFGRRVLRLEGIQVEEGKFKVVMGSDVWNTHVGSGKKQSSLWRRFKGHERNNSKLKGCRNMDMSSNSGSSSESSRSSSCSGKIERKNSAFSFSRFKNKLKQAIKKDQQHGLSENGLLPPKTTVREKKVGGNHIYVDRVPKSSGLKKVDRMGIPKDSRMKLGHDTTLPSEQRVAALNAEGRKHLDNVVGDGGTDVDRFFSYSSCGSSSIHCPKKHGTKGHVDDKTCEARENIVSLKNEGTNDSVDDKACHQVKQELNVSSHMDVGHLVDETSIVKAICELEGPIIEDIAISSDVASIISLPSDIPQDYLSTILSQDINDENGPSSMTEKNKGVDVMSDTTSKPSLVSVLQPIFKDNLSRPFIKSFTAIRSIQPQRINFEQQISSSQKPPNTWTYIDGNKPTVNFVKEVIQMSGLTWDELLRRTLLSDHLIEPSLIDEVDFLPDYLPCDFNLLFHLIIEVLTDIYGSNFTCMLSLTNPSVHPELKGKDLFKEVWKEVEWYLKLEWVPRLLDRTIKLDLAKDPTWRDIHSDCESVGILVQQAILDELVDDTVLNCSIPLSAGVEEAETSTELG